MEVLGNQKVAVRIAGLDALAKSTSGILTQIIKAGPNDPGEYAYRHGMPIFLRLLALVISCCIYVVQIHLLSAGCANCHHIIHHCLILYPMAAPACI